MLDISYELWKFVFEKEEARYTDLIKAFVDTQKCAKQTLINYKKELEASGRIDKKISKKTRKPVYFVPERAHPEIQNLIKKRESHELISSLDTRWLNPLRWLLIKAKHEGRDPQRFLNGNCITFIGNVPCSFPKSVEGMQSHLAFKKSLHNRRQRELAPRAQEYMEMRKKYGRGSKESLDLFERIREEIGWTDGEYLETLLKKAAQEKGFHKIMTVLGITDEMLEEIYRRQQRHDPSV